MHKEIYGVVETTFGYPSRNFSMMNDTEDLENGALVHKGELIPDATDPFANYVYEATIPTAASIATDKVYLVAHPAWEYDRMSSVCHNEEFFTNEAGKIVRTYELIPENKFAITDYSIDPISTATPVEVGQFVGLQAGKTSMKASATIPTGSAFVGVIERIETRGAVYNTGQSVDLTKNMVVIRIVKNG